MSNRLGGKQGTAYLGTNADQPPNMIFSDRNPNQYDIFNVSLGDFWINDTNETVWCLVSLTGTSTSQGSLAAWTELGLSSSELDTLTGNSGGAVSPDISNNINVIGDGTTITVTGSPSTNTLTASLIPGSAAITLTANSGGAVSPDAGGNINVIGDGTTIDIVGNPGTNTLTASVISSVNVTLTGNSGGAVGTDGGGNIDLVGDGTTITITGNPGTNTLTASIVSGGAIDTLTGDSGGAVAPDGMGNINILGTPNVITVTGNPGTNTLTIDSGSTVATSYATDSGSAVPSAGVLTIAGGTNLNTSGAGSTVTINLDSTLTGITDLTVNNLTVNTSTTLGYLTRGVVQSSSAGVISSSEGTDGQVLISSSSGAPAWRTLTAGSNITVTNGANSITIAASSAGAGSGMVLLATKDATGLSVIDFTSLISATYRSYMLVADKLAVGALGAAGTINMRYSSDNGSTFYSTVSRGGLNYSAYNSTAVSNFNNNATSNYFPMAYLFASADDQYVSFTYFLYDLPNTDYIKPISGDFITYTQASSNLYQGRGASAFYYGGTLPGSGIAVNAFRIYGQTFIAGTLELYGLTN